MSHSHVHNALQSNFSFYKKNKQKKKKKDKKRVRDKKVERRVVSTLIKGMILGLRCIATATFDSAPRQIIVTSPIIYINLLGKGRKADGINEKGRRRRRAHLGVLRLA